ncbi:Pectate lyase superfamily protein [Macrococcoides canis]|uniref:Pectate lyase superfamily protein n=1 Tax=Macrococcoides canis TaxID=1855823 RepID=A0A1W7ABP8_9STAP|nr:NosD domain-containing protein [Macrococcus canis]ARQ07033.1 Pectate lyase superfamily protein [Macrococcus canis]
MEVNSLKTKNNFHNYITIKQADNTSPIELLLCGPDGSVINKLNQNCTLTLLDTKDRMIRQKSYEKIIDGVLTFKVVNDLKANIHSLEITTADGQKFPSDGKFTVYVSDTHDDTELNIINNLSLDETFNKLANNLVENAVEEKFTLLSSDTQGQTEVILARKNFQSLGARLDRFDEKSSHIYNLMEFESAKTLMGDGNYDFTPVFKAAVDAAPDGSVINIPAGEFIMLNGLIVQKNITFVGVGFNTVIKPVNFAFQFGVKDPRKDVFGSIFNIRFQGDNTRRGHTSRMYGSTNASLAFTTKTTSLAGTSSAARGVIFQGVYSPAQVDGCYFYDLDEGLVGLAQYGMSFTNNKFWYCNVNIKLGQWVTTVNIQNNTIERGAIGIFGGYASTKVTIIDNVIEANYAGCDILLYGNGEDYSIKRNYFEASPDVIVLRADSSGDFSPHKIYIEDNFGVKVFVRCDIGHLYLKHNNMRDVQFEIPIGTKLQNIVFEDNYEWSTRNPYDIEYVTLNSEAAKYIDEITFINHNTHRPSKPITKPIYKGFITQKSSFYKVSSSAVAERGFSLEVPNDSLNAIVEIRALKSKSILAKSPREILFRGAIKRTADATTLAQLKKIEEITYDEINATAIGVGTAPTTTVTGNTTDVQKVDFNFLNYTAGSSAEWHFDVKVITSHTGIKILS